MAKRKWKTVVGEHAAPTTAPAVPTPEVRGAYLDSTNTGRTRLAREDLARIATSLGLDSNDEFVLGAIARLVNQGLTAPVASPLVGDPQSLVGDNDERPLSDPPRGQKPRRRTNAHAWNWRRDTRPKDLGRHPRDRRA